MSDVSQHATHQQTRPSVHRRSSSLDRSMLDRLERQIAQRPEKTELVDRNILKDDRVAPSLQAQRDALEKSQLHDKLDHAIRDRPSPEDLVSKGILAADEVPANA